MPAVVALTQPDHLPELQEHHRWIHDNTVCYELAFPDRPRTSISFVPCQRIRDLFRDDEYTHVARLRDLVLSERAHQVPKRDLAEDYAVVFCILLSLGKGSHILTFAKNYDLRDSQLPFTNRPDSFPRQHDDFWQAFSEKQWEFCCPSIGRFNDSNIRDEYILPFQSCETLEARGGSAVIQRVTVHEDYDRLQSVAQEGITPTAHHTYIIKTYQGELGKECYHREVSAFRRLSEDGRPNPSMIKYYGSFRHRGTFNVILEHATAGTLDDFFETQDPPTKGEDIIAFWRSLFEIIKALDRLHEQNVNRHEAQQYSVLHGWHRDIKPKNILVMHRNNVSPYRWLFKLADLGLSHVQPATTGGIEEGVPDNGGTSTYGPPELHARTDHLTEQRIEVKRSSDVWSLGCVFSEATVWVVSGWRRLLECRELRQHDLDRHRDFLGGNCFHNGTRMRQSVRKIHEDVTDEARYHDCITPLVVYLVENHMLHEKPDARFNTKQLHIAVEEACADATQELDERRNSTSPRSASGPHTRPSTVLERHHSQDSWQLNRGGSSQSVPPPFMFSRHAFVRSPAGSVDDLGRVDEEPDHRGGGDSYNRPSPPHPPWAHPSWQSSKRTASVNAPGSRPLYANGYHHGMARSSSLRTSQTAPDHHVSFDEGTEYTTGQHSRQLPSRPMRSALRSSSGQEFNECNVSPDHAVQPMSLENETEDDGAVSTQAQHNQEYSPNFNTSTPHSAKPRPAEDESTGHYQQTMDTAIQPTERTTPRSSDSRTNTLSSLPVGQRATEVDWGRQSGKSNGQTSTDRHESQPGDPLEDESERFARKLQAEYDAMGSIKDYRQTTALQVSESNIEPNASAKSGKVTYVKPQDFLSVGTAIRFRQERKKLEHGHPNNFRSLKGRDHIFLIDDSASMAPYWDEMENLLEALIYIVKGADPDGVELCFMRSAEKGKSKNSTKLMELVKSIVPIGDADPLTRLNILIHERIQKYTQPATKRRTYFPGGSKTPDNATIYILTTGQWQPGCDLKPLIATLVQKLREQRLSPAPVGIQFIRFGSDEECKRKLDHYDNGLGLELDIVDSEHSHGNVWKMLLGSINIWFDNDERQPQSDTRTSATP